jgi:predicted Fe-Mo cluster-binding NifX family protein
MKIAISIWNESLSNVFDFSTEVLVVDIEDSKQKTRTNIDLGDCIAQHKAVRLKDLGVETLICGAISREIVFALDGLGIEVLAYVTGSVNEVIEALLDGSLDAAKFVMPGCWHGARSGFGSCMRKREMRRGCKRVTNQKGDLK